MTLSVDYFLILIIWSPTGKAASKQVQTMMLPPPCFISGRLFWLCSWMFYVLYISLISPQDIFQTDFSFVLNRRTFLPADPRSTALSNKCFPDGRIINIHTCQCLRGFRVLICFSDCDTACFSFTCLELYFNHAKFIPAIISPSATNKYVTWTLKQIFVFLPFNL